MSRHTRQGLARGQHDPELYDADRDYGSHQAANNRDRLNGPTVDDLTKRLGDPWASWDTGLAIERAKRAREAMGTEGGSLTG